MQAEGHTLGQGPAVAGTAMGSSPAWSRARLCSSGAFSPAPVEGFIEGWSGIQDLVDGEDGLPDPLGLRPLPASAPPPATAHNAALILAETWAGNMKLKEPLGSPCLPHG